VPCVAYPSWCRALRILRGALLCDVLGVFAPEVCRVVLLWGSWRKTSPPSLRFFLPKDLFGCNLFLSGATLIRVVLEKRLPPFLMSRCPEVFLLECLMFRYKICLPTRQCAETLFFVKKTSPPFFHAVVLEGLSSFCFG